MRINRVRQALQDPDVLMLMQLDPEMAEYFDDDGKLLVDTTTPGLSRQIVENIKLHWRKRA